MYFTHHDDGAYSMGEEQDSEGDGKGQVAEVRNEEHHVHEEGEELADGVEDAKYHEGHQEARALGSEEI